GLLSSAFGGGGSAAAGTAGSIGSSAAGAGSSVAGAGASLASSAVSGAIAAAGAIAGALMTKGNLKRTEENTRETRDWLELQTGTWNPLFFADTINLGRISDNTANLGDIIFTAAEGLRSGLYNAFWEVGSAIIDAIR